RRRIRSLAQKLERRSQPALLSRLKSQLHHASSWMMALATKTVCQVFSALASALSKLFSFLLWLGQKSRTLRPRFPSWRPRLEFQVPKPNLAPAMRFGRQAFFFLAGLGGLVLKALLTALIFL